jgi:hypothetical protein
MEIRWLRWPLILSGVFLLVLLAGFLWLVADFGANDITRSIRQSESADGRFVAEVREVITRMHGGPDSVQVTLRATKSALGDVVFSQTFECGPDYSAFQVEWKSPQSLVIQEGMCDAGRYSSASNNKVLQKSEAWHQVKISYRRSDHVAHADLNGFFETPAGSPASSATRRWWSNRTEPIRPAPPTSTMR